MFAGFCKSPHKKVTRSVTFSFCRPFQSLITTKQQILLISSPGDSILLDHETSVWLSQASVSWFYLASDPYQPTLVLLPIFLVSRLSFGKVYSTDVMYCHFIM